MQVILLERIQKLGQMGELVNVKPGYARNFLLPQKKALRATKENLEQFESRRQHLEAENLKQREEAEAVASKMGGLHVLLLRQASESDHLYGSVSIRDITTAIMDAGVAIQRKQVLLDHPLKTLGLHTARIALHPEVIVDVTINVSRSEEEARLREEGQAAKAAEPATAAQAAEDVFEESVLDELAAEETAEAAPSGEEKPAE
ncbi:MAG: 50S ribosomal protein L9 [Rhodospirillaceae bacterium]|nr:MAG: 50S ribosomal protein L9 [Rhodospirillaceae bacterium]